MITITPDACLGSYFFDTSWIFLEIYYLVWPDEFEIQISIFLPWYFSLTVLHPYVFLLFSTFENRSINKKICHLIGLVCGNFALYIVFSGVNGFFFSKFKIITSTTDCVKNNNTGVLTFLILIHQMTQLIWYTCIYIHDGFIFLNKKLICRGVFQHLHLGTKHLSKSYQTLKKIMHLWSIVMLISNTMNCT